jgi:hypothetical protein
MMVIAPINNVVTFIIRTSSSKQKIPKIDKKF